MFNRLYYFISHHALASGCRNQKKPGANALRLIGIAPKRCGVTVLEVLFATGIAVFGMVGIASLLAVAGRQASDANNWSEGQAAAQNALSDFVVRSYANSALWMTFNDQSNSASFPAHFVNYKSMGTSISRGTSSGGVRTDNRYAVCIDPYFFSDPTTVENVLTKFVAAQPYRPGLFPYFQDNFNPLDPSNPLGGNAGRLLRVGLKNPTGGLLSAKAVDRQFQLLDDLAITTDEDDKTLPSERVFSSDAAQGLSNGSYSWFATLCPREVSMTELSDATFDNTNYPENLFTLSIVVCKRRDRAFYVPASGQQGPLGERVVTVIPTNDDGTPIANFKGGSGGRVVLSAARDLDNPALDISDSLRAGDWVMLCREQSLSSGGLGTICRWYRVLTLDVESVISAGSSWSRSVVLHGPDWVFDSTGTYPTQATLVSGVVTVAERVIPVRY